MRFIKRNSAKLRNCAFGILVLASLFTSTTARAFLDDVHMQCYMDPWLQFLDCHQNLDDYPGDGVATCADINDGVCLNLCHQAGVSGRAILASSPACDDGPPVTFRCWCGLGPE